MTTVNIDSVGHDEHGRCYDLGEDAPWDAITVNEADGTITLHGSPPLEEAAADLLALERDRLLGFPADELHKPPQAVVERAWHLLSARNPGFKDEYILRDDQQTLGLESPEPEQTGGADDSEASND